jgi:HrpA-like RNA helicase
VALLLLRLGAGTLRNFAFVQPPPPAQLEAALASLRALGALDAHETLTPLGG